MIYLALLYFVLLLIWIVRRHGFDASAYVTSLYVMTSFFAVLMDLTMTDLIPEAYKNPSIISGIVYCLLITLLILPVYRFNSNCLRNVFVRHPKALNLIALFFFAAFVFKVIFYSPDIAFKIAYGDWAALRKMQLDDSMFTIVHFSGIMMYVDLVFTVFGALSFIMFPIFFVSICFLNKPWWFNLMCILATTTVILEGIIGIDRSQSFRWLLFLGLNLVMFWKCINRSVRRVIVPMIGGIVFLIFVYLTSITVSRFENSGEGVAGGLVRYAGMSPIEFMYFYDNFDNREGFNTIYFMPATHYWIIKDYFGNVSRQEELSRKTGMVCGTFYTVLGTFVMDANQIGPFVFVLIYLLLFSRCLPRGKAGKMSLWTLTTCYLLIIIPTFGIIAYPYTSPYASLSVWGLVLSHFVVNVFSRLSSRKTICVPSVK